MSAIAASTSALRSAHAGEEGGPETVTAPLDILRVERVDHGVRAMEDPTLVRRLRDERMRPTVCPLYNVCLRVVDTLADHPLPAMLADGLLVPGPKAVTLSDHHPCEASCRSAD